MPTSVDKSGTRTAVLTLNQKGDWRRTGFARPKDSAKDRERRWKLAAFIIECAIWAGLVLWGLPKLLETIEYVAQVTSGSP